MALIRIFSLYFTLVLLILLAIFGLLRQKPSGATWIFYTTRGAPNSEIWRMNPDGTGKQLLISDPKLWGASIVSPDGRWIAYSSAHDAIYEVTIAPLVGSSPPSMISHDLNPEEPSWSPTGEWIAFSSSSFENLVIYIIRPDGTDLQQLTESGGRNFSPSWSPDGNMIAYVSQHRTTSNIVRMQLDGSHIQTLTSNPGSIYGPAWSPDGQWIAFTGSALSISLIRTDGSELRHIPNLPTNCCYDPTWSPDGQWLAFARSDEYDAPDIYRICLDGTDLQQLTNKPSIEYAPVWSPPIDHPYSPLPLIEAALGLLILAAISIYRLT